MKWRKMNMKNVNFPGRRSFLGFAAAFLVAGCYAEPLLQNSPREQYSVRQVTVDTAAFTGVTGRVNEFSKEDVARDIRATLAHALRKSATGTTPVDVTVRLTGVHLVSPGQSLLIGGTSAISGVLEVKDVRSGAMVLEPTKVYGTAKGAYAPGGIIGAISTRSVDDDYRRTIAGFSGDVERRLFGAVDTTNKPSAKTLSPKTDPATLTEAERQARAEAQEEARKCRQAITITCAKVN